MSKYALIVGGNVIQIVDQDPVLLFHPSIAGDFVPVPDEVEVGFTVEGEGKDAVFSPPVAPEPVTEPEPVVVAKTFSALEFLDLFTLPEEIAIRGARLAGDLYVESFMDRLDKANLIHLDDPRVVAGLDYLVVAELITPERHDHILTGAAPVVV
jgi:hypothetical protein